MTKNSFKITDIIYAVVLAGLFQALTCLFYRQSVKYNGGYASDMAAYITGFEGDIDGRFIMVVFRQLMKINGSTLPVALFCAAVVVGTIIAGYYFLSYMLERENVYRERWQLQAMSLIVLFSGPIYVPGIYEHIYMKTWPKYAWHSPTEQSMVLFSILAMLFFFKVYDDGKYMEKINPVNWICFTVFLFMSAWAKPNFMLVITPVAAVFFIVEMIRRKEYSIGRRLKGIVIFGCGMIPAGIFMVILNMLLFPSDGSSDSSIAVRPGYFLEDIRHPFVMIILSLAFALFVIVMNISALRDFYYRIITWIALMGIGEYLIFVEDGPRINHANFGWCRQIGLYLLFMMTAVLFMKNFRDKEFLGQWRKVRSLYFIIGAALLAMHVISQVVFVCYLLKGGLYRI